MPKFVKNKYNNLKSNNIINDINNANNNDDKINYPNKKE